MAADRDLCCCCIRLRLAVGVVSLVYLAITAATTYQKYKANNTDDNTAKIVIYTSAALQTIIALVGLLAAITKAVRITKLFSILWWALVCVVLALSLANLALVARNDKESILEECRKDLKPSDGIAVTDEEANSCYKTALIVSGVVLGLQFVVMCLIGWIIQRFLREVRQDAEIKAALKAVDEGQAEAEEK